MPTTSDYRQRAERCLRLASTTIDTAIAASLQQLAADNFAMAEEGKAQVAQLQQQIQPKGPGPKASDGVAAKRRLLAHP